jgi:hypothetical protein
VQPERRVPAVLDQVAWHPGGGPERAVQGNELHAAAGRQVVEHAGEVGGDLVGGRGGGDPEVEAGAGQHPAQPPARRDEVVLGQVEEG